MKFYESELKKAGFEVEYIESSSKFSDIRNLIQKLKKENFTKNEPKYGKFCKKVN